MRSRIALPSLAVTDLTVRHRDLEVQIATLRVELLQADAPQHAQHALGRVSPLEWTYLYLFRLETSEQMEPGLEDGGVVRMEASEGSSDQTLNLGG